MQCKLLKIIFAFAIIGFGVMCAASAQDNAGRDSDGSRNSSRRSASAGENADSIIIYNDTGFTVKNIFIYRAGSKDWGENILSNLLFNKANVAINLDGTYDRTALYNIRLMDVDGDYYTRNDISLGERRRIRVDIYDLDLEWRR